MSECKKVLGIYIDAKLSFKEHVYDCVNKASRMWALILHNVKFVVNSVLIKLFKCFIRPLFEYVSVVYLSHHIGLIYLIEKCTT